MAESSSRECCAYGGPRAGVASGGVRAPRGVRCRERPSPSSRPGRTRQIPMTEEHRRNILWADDEIELLRPHIKFLEQKGFSVTAVPNGEDALTELGRGRYDLVLLEEMMPGLGGLETLDQIQSRDLGVPVILVTKSEEETLMDQAIGRAITDYLIKPVNPSQVFIACKRVFDAQRLQESQRTRDYVSEMQRWQALDLRALDSEGWINLAVEV